MTLCPMALAVGCRKCPIFSFCPAKGLIGDYRQAESTADPTSTQRPKAQGPAKAKRRKGK